jgi:hypothetical protein
VAESKAVKKNNYQMKVNGGKRKRARNDLRRKLKR